MAVVVSVPQGMVLGTLPVTGDGLPLRLRGIDSNMQIVFLCLANQSLDELDIGFASTPVLRPFNVEPDGSESVWGTILGAAQAQLSDHK